MSNLEITEKENLIVTGKVAIGKTYSVVNLLNSIPNENVQLGYLTENQELKKHIKSFYDKIEERKSLEHPCEDSYLVIDEAWKFVDELESNNDFLEVVKTGREFGVYVIIITQYYGKLEKLGDEVLNNFTVVNIVDRSDKSS